MIPRKQLTTLANSSKLTSPTGHLAACRAIPASTAFRLSRQYATPPGDIRPPGSGKPQGGIGGMGGFPGMRFPGGTMMGQQGPEKGETLKQYSIDLTDFAKQGKLDPVIGRDAEIRRTIQILSRRTKSNPVLLGLPGVGKTAILEGLAQRIVNREVPESLHDKRLLSLDLSALMAGTGVRGEFESRFKALLKDIEDENHACIVFMDEIHNLLNLGKAEGSISGSEIIKPALARGLQLVGATTPDEYRKTIEKDAALQRRFQPITVSEPSVESTISILRGIKARFEAHHGVSIADSALVTAAVYADRYVPDRYLPDKAIDLIDESCASLKLAQESRPAVLEQLDRDIVTLEIESASLKNESDGFSVDRRTKVDADLLEKKAEQRKLADIWADERAKFKDIKDIKERIDRAVTDLDAAQRAGDYEQSSKIRYGLVPSLQKKLSQIQANASANAEVEGGMVVRDRVTSEDISVVVSRSTGIPVTNLLKGERERLVHMEDSLGERVVGQAKVVKSVSDAIRLSRAGLQSPSRPLASFLFLGPTGCGKTELSKALAGFLFDDEKRALVQLNMSEFHDKHTLSRLIGTTAGYIGYEEGGSLTEAVRRRPHSLICFDEIEKAHPDIANILLQILDEGTLADGSGRVVNFKNTIIVVTSNLGSEYMYEPNATNPDGSVTDATRSEMMTAIGRYFRPEVINRLDEVLVFNKLPRSTVLDIVALRLREVQTRLDPYRIALDVDKEARQYLADKGFSDKFGARAITRVVRDRIVTPIASRMLDGSVKDGDTVQVRLVDDVLNISNYSVSPKVAEEGEQGGEKEVVFG